MRALEPLRFGVSGCANCVRRLQLQPKAAAFAGVGFDADVAPHPLHRFLLDGQADAGAFKEAYELGANAFLVKPPGIPERVEIARFLKGWLRYNRFAPL